MGLLFRRDMIVKVGFEFKRMLNKSEQELLNLTLDFCKETFPSNSKAIFWSNIYIRKQFTLVGDFTSLDSWVNQVVDEISPSKKKHILGYGFLVNPKGNAAGQPFHIDYGPTESCIFVPLTLLTEKNATQYLVDPINKTSLTEALAGFQINNFKEKEGLDFLEVRQAIGSPFSLLHMLPGTPHRGIPNLEDFDRIMFWISIDDYYHESLESTTYEYSDKDYGPV